MDGVSFTEEQPQASIGVTRTSGIAAFVIRAGIAKDEKEATTVLIGTVVAALLIMGGIWFFGGDTSELPPSEVVPGTTL